MYTVLPDCMKLIPTSQATQTKYNANIFTTIFRLFLLLHLLLSPCHFHYIFLHIPFLNFAFCLNSVSEGNWEHVGLSGPILPVFSSLFIPWMARGKAQNFNMHAISSTFLPVPVYIVLLKPTNTSQNEEQSEVVKHAFLKSSQNVWQHHGLRLAANGLGTFHFCQAIITFIKTYSTDPFQVCFRQGFLLGPVVIPQVGRNWSRHLWHGPIHSSRLGSDLLKLSVLIARVAPLFAWKIHWFFVYQSFWFLIATALLIGSCYFPAWKRTTREKPTVETLLKPAPLKIPDVKMQLGLYFIRIFP